MWSSWRQQPAQEQQNNFISYNDYYEDERYLETIDEVESIRERPQSVAHPQALRDLPFRALPSAQDKSRITSSVYSVDPAAHRNSRIASSLYSQPSPTYPPPDLKTTALPQLDQQADISPVSSPRSNTHPMSDSGTISPIEPSMPMKSRSPLPEHGFRSQIPRPVASTDSGTGAQSRLKKTGTRWDDYSGEQTAAETGKRGSVRVGEQSTLEMQFPHLKERTKQILAGLRDRDAPKVGWNKPASPVADVLDAPVQQKPAWRGASGREATVDPVRNDPTARTGPIQVPERNPRRISPGDTQAQTKAVQDRSETTTPEQPTELQPVREPSPVVQEVTTPRAEQTIRALPSQESMKPVAPLKVRVLKSKAMTDPGKEATLQSPFQSPQPGLQQRSQTQTLETNQDQHETQSLAEEPSRSGYTTPRPSVETSNTNLQPPSDPEETSRFSWTTYATTVNDSPPTMHHTTNDVAVPPIPALPGSIAARSRPVPSMSSRGGFGYSNSEARFSNVSILTRKPVGSDRRRSSSMQSSTAKDLPPPPPPEDIQTGDKISTLEARQAQLVGRRRNNGRIRNELSEALKRNAIIYDMYKRREVEDRIKELQRECDEITNEEHEVGVQLHRAQRKRDKYDEFGAGTALWIHRVTQ